MSPATPTFFWRSPMPNCKVHARCDLVCARCGDYYCQGQHGNCWIHVKWPKVEAAHATHH